MEPGLSCFSAGRGLRVVIMERRLGPVLRPLLCALGFLTRLPVPHVELTEPDVAKSAGYFAWVGLLLGGLLLGAAVLFEQLGLGAALSSLCVVALWAYLTGGLHLDGLADTVDGLSGGRGDKERTLSVMRDSRIGSHGATALMLALALKAAALARIFELHALELVWLVPAVARFACTCLLASFPYARGQGLGSAFAGRVGLRELSIGASAIAWPFFVLGPVGVPYAACASLGVVCALLVAWRSQRALGGLTGDVHGAAVEVCEIGMLLGLCAFPLR